MDTMKTLTPLHTPAAPARLTVSDRLRLGLATMVGDAAALASRLAKKGSGSSIRGQLLTRIDPHAFASLLRGRRIIAISGTNGKTTTTHFVAAAVKDALGSHGDRMVTNADGANLHYGIASALAKARRSDIAVLETDERVVADLVRDGKPEILVLLNFSRDQLDRHHEIKALGRAWRDALSQAGAQAPVVVANADDPLVVWAASVATHTVWVQVDSTWHADSVLCPACGALLNRQPSQLEHPGVWDCPGCDLTQPQADYVVHGGKITLPGGRVLMPRLKVPGKFNVNNAACALGAVALWGIGPDAALRSMEKVESPAGRFSTTTIGDGTYRLILAKNPAGWTEALPLLTTDPVILAIDSVAADGKDVSWLWDVPFEDLQGRHVIVTGPRCADLAVRLSYAEVSHEMIPELAVALAKVEESIDVIATYTPFQQLLKMGGLR